MTFEDSNSRLWTPMSRRRLLARSAYLGGGLAAAAALTACGGDDDDDSPSPTNTTAAGGNGSTPSAATQVPTPPANVPEEFIFAMEREPADLMPFFGAFDQVVALRGVNETLIRVNMTDEDQSGIAEVEYEGVLAESWERPDEVTWTFKIRPGVTFHDGEPWNAEAAATTFDTFLDAELAQSLGKFSISSRYFDRVEAVDEYTLQMSARFPIVEQEFFGLAFYLTYSAFSPKALNEMGIEGMRQAPVGTGPYLFDQWRTGQDITLVKNPDYWGQHTNIDRFRFVWRPEASVRAQTVRTGEAHFAWNIGPEQASSLENSVVGGGFQSNTLRLHNQKAPTDDIRVRRAINYALDKDGINAAIFGGTATPIGFFAYQPVEVPVWPYDPQQARALLEEAGAIGQEVELIYGEGRVPEEDQLAEIYKAQIDAVGLNVKLTKLERLQYSEVDQGPIEQKPALFMETTSSGNYGEVAGSLLDKYGCEGSGTFCNPAWDEEFTALNTLEGEERNSTIQDIATRLQEEETPRAWIMGINQVHGLAPNVATNFGINVYVHPGDLSFA